MICFIMKGDEVLMGDGNCVRPARRRRLRADLLYLRLAYVAGARQAELVGRWVRGAFWSIVLREAAVHFARYTSREFPSLLFHSVESPANLNLATLIILLIIVFIPILAINKDFPRA